MNMFPDYGAYLGMFLEKEYRIEPLKAGKLSADGVLYLRHDIDFDLRLALDMARIEASIGVQSTYF
jgi:hypothetical protein